MRLLLADDHALVRGGLRALVSALPDVTEVLEAGDGQEALAAVVTHHPDVVLMDISMPRLNGIDATSLIRAAAPETRVIVLSMHCDDEHVRSALRAGASGYLAKSSIADELRQALCAIARGEVFVSGSLQRAAGSERPPALTGRQVEILRLIADGMSSREIAQELHITLKTVESHRLHLMRRLDIHDVAGLVRYAARHGLIQVN